MRVYNYSFIYFIVYKNKNIYVYKIMHMKDVISFIDLITLLNET